MSIKLNENKFHSAEESKRECDYQNETKSNNYDQQSLRRDKFRERMCTKEIWERNRMSICFWRTVLC